MEKTDIVLVANSPGELSALVKPVAEEFAKNNTLRLILVLTPCQYTSGKELEFSKTIPGISNIIPAKDYKKWAFLNQKPKGITFSKKGSVLYLGGDLLHAILVAKRLGYPADAYINETIAWRRFYRKFYISDQQTLNKFSKQLPKGKSRMVGNLMVDSIQKLKKWEPEDMVLTFMPGSRRWEIDYMLPFYEEVIKLIEFAIPNIRFQLVSSPFVKAKAIEGATTVSFEDIFNSELMVTIPGTNTAKIAARGIPMLVVFPLNNPEVIPLDGLADIIGKLPVVGRVFKKVLAKIINKRTRFFSLPNQKAGYEIVPEIRGQITPAEVSQKIIALFNDPVKRKQMSANLIKSMGPPGAARKIVEDINAGI